MGIFEQATRQAVEEILRENSDRSEFGFFMNEEMMDRAIEDIYQLLAASRQLKARGDQLFSTLATD